jgi:murein hydrolase activator
MIARIVLLFFFLNIGSLCLAQSRAELEKQRNAALKEIAETEEILGSLKKDKQSSLEMLELINRKLSLRNSLIANLSSDVTKVEAQITDIDNQVNLLNKDIKKIKDEYGKLIYRAYLNRNRYTPLMFILSSKDINQAYKRLKYIRQYSDYRKQQVKAISNLSVDLTNEIALLEAQKVEKSRLIKNKEAEIINLRQEEAQKTSIIAGMKSKERELGEKLREKNKIADKLKREIERTIRAEINRAKEAKKKDTKYVEPAEDIALSSDFRDNRGKLPWPTEKGIITGFFGERNHPEYRGVKIKNDGIDISTPGGAYVRAIFDGEVRHVFTVLGANNTILIRHGNYYSLYSNIVDVRVKTGDKVKTKQILGKIFTDDRSKSTVLHVELYENLTKLDPQLWLVKN